MKATFHISKIMKDANGNIRKVGSMERIMTTQLAIEMIQKKLAEFFVKKDNFLEEVVVVKTESWWAYLKTQKQRKFTDTLEKLPTYK